MTMPHIDPIERLGFGVIPDLLTEELRRELVMLFDREDGRVGRRDGLGFGPVRAAATSAAVGGIVRAILGGSAFATKATLFGKTPSSNWLVPWHQDVTIPVRESRPTLGFDTWSTKGGIPHARPPLQVLESMLAVRLDLDGSTETNGPLHVLAGTHNRGILGAHDIQAIRRSQSSVTCLVPPSGALIMRPLLLHASSRATAPEDRRIIHIEFATGQLPGGLEWYDRYAISQAVQLHDA
ncbi:MAG: ectoine hydroxylase-related dioxygenase (phytanoyl-CoA dioxygenase family), partial [Planctomycetota bacterium]